MAHSITYPTPGETVPALPRGRAASMGCWQGDVGRVDAPPQGDSCALRKRWQSMLGIQSIRKIPVVERLSRQREESIVTAWGFSLTGFPTGRTDMSPTWLWHHCDLTYWLKIKAIIHRELFLLTDRSSHHGLTGTSLVIRTHRNKHRKCWMHLRWRRMKGWVWRPNRLLCTLVHVGVSIGLWTARWCICTHCCLQQERPGVWIPPGQSLSVQSFLFICVGFLQVLRVSPPSKAYFFSALDQGTG